MISVGPYIYIEFYRILLFYYFIDLCHIFNQFNLKSEKILIYGVYNLLNINL